ncbi:MAG: tetratricopeptide repeat protein [Polyangiaceae bacterium]
MRLVLRSVLVALSILGAGCDSQPASQPVVSAPVLDGNLAHADGLIRAGNYVEGIAELRRVGGADAPLARLHLAAALLETGDLTGAAAALAGDAGDADAALLTAQIDRAAGRYSAARTRLEEHLAKTPNDLHARVELGRLLEDLGQLEAARVHWKWVLDELEAGRLDDQRADVGIAVGAAQRSAGRFHEALDAFEVAAQADSSSTDAINAKLDLGDLLLEKYNAGDAFEAFSEVLSVHPNQPDALAGCGRALLEAGQAGRASAYVDRALAVNPNHPGALLARARIAIEDRQFDVAASALDTLLTANPNLVDGHAMRAALAWLRGDLQAFEAEKNAALAVDPRPARVVHVVAHFASAAHRDADVVSLGLDALKTAPNDGGLLTDVGLAYIRLGDDTNARLYVDKAFRADPYNALLFEELQLLDALPRDYVARPISDALKLRAHHTEMPMLERYVPQLLEAGLTDMKVKYGFAPTPVTVEIFADRASFDRANGFFRDPDAKSSVYGTTNGQLITAISPSAYDGLRASFSSALWHELDHVFTLQLSRRRVPRWVAEGLAELDAATKFPEAALRGDADIQVLVQSRGSLPSLLQLTELFASSVLRERLAAYQLAFHFIRFASLEWGFPAVRRAVQLYAEKPAFTADFKPIAVDADIWSSATGASMTDIEARFAAEMRRVLAPYATTFHTGSPTDLATAQERSAMEPTNGQRLAELAYAAVSAGVAADAATAAQAALKLEPKNKLALLVEARLALDAGAPDAEQRLDALVAAGGDGYDARMMRGALRSGAGQFAAARALFDQAKEVEPESGEPYMAAAATYEKEGRAADGLREREAAVRHELDPAWLLDLVDRYAEMGDWAKVKELGEWAITVAPVDAIVHYQLASAYAHIGNVDPAIFEFESSLLGTPALARPARAYRALAAAYAGKKDKARAVAAINKAKELEPTDQETLSLEAKIKAL